jgi:peptidyl-prolyl cis-trans isomerase SurA
MKAAGDLTTRFVIQTGAPRSGGTCGLPANTWASILMLLLILLAAPCAIRAKAVTPTTAVLDRVVAVVGDQAILASDVDAEMRFAAFEPEPEPAADNTPQRALQRVIDRTLIEEQRALQPGIAAIPQKEIEQSIAELRATIPACAKYDCKTDAGWSAFVAAQGFTKAEVADRIRERLELLNFINLRFGVAARVPNADVQNYYYQVFKPKLEQAKAAVPQLAAVASRIREILRQQQVSAMLDQWLKSLRSEEHVRILDSAYGDEEVGQ